MWGRPGTALVSGAASSSTRSSTSLTVPTTSHKGRRTRDAEIIRGQKTGPPGGGPIDMFPAGSRSQRSREASEARDVTDRVRRPSPLTRTSTVDACATASGIRTMSARPIGWFVVTPRWCHTSAPSMSTVTSASAKPVPSSTASSPCPRSCAVSPLPRRGPRDRETYPAASGSSTQLSEFPRSTTWTVSGAFFERASSVAS